MKRINIALSFTDSGYIGKPFWPETNTLIDISKDVHPKLGEAKKAAALLAACEKRNISVDQYKAMVAKSEHPFYTIGDVRAAEIVVPQRVIQSFLNMASMEVPRAIPKIAEKGLTFIGVKVEGGYLRTGKHERDAKAFARFVKNQESNQRRFESELYIEQFEATGILLVDEEVIKSEDLRKLMEYGGKMYGIGSARPQGYGRFTVTRWDELN
jgi:hypothetical protein